MLVSLGQILWPYHLKMVSAVPVGAKWPAKSPSFAISSLFTYCPLISFALQKRNFDFAEKERPLINYREFAFHLEDRGNVFIGFDPRSYRPSSFASNSLYGTCLHECSSDYVVFEVR